MNGNILNDEAFGFMSEDMKEEFEKAARELEGKSIEEKIVLINAFVNKMKKKRSFSEEERKAVAEAVMRKM